MSVFRNIGLGDPPIQGEGIDYTGGGTTITVGVARGLDDEVRIAMWDSSVDTQVVLTHADVRRLIARLTEAIE